MGVDIVVAHLKMERSDVKVLQQLPTLVEELTWRPRRELSGSAAASDALAEMVMTFHTGNLARLVVVYEREGTQALTDADLLEALGAVYGSPSLTSTPTMRSPVPVSDRRTLGRWEDAASVVLLWRELYPNRVGLIITSIPADLALQTAIAEGTRLYVAAAPQRETARRAEEAAAILQREETLRLQNKAKFKPQP